MNGRRKTRRIIDISLGISPSMLTWPGDPDVEITRTSSIAKGDAANVSRIMIGTHTGTHIDPPIHFIPDSATVDEVALDVLIGDALVVDMTGRTEITAADIAATDLGGSHRVLFRTDNSNLWNGDSSFPDTYVALTSSAAGALVERGVDLVGVDFLSVERRGAEGHPTHVALLGAGVVVVEGLDLRDVPPGHYQLICLPLKIEGGDGGPARAVLIS